MRYPGSKRRIASALRDVIFAHKGDRDIYIEPFVGGANSFTRIAPLFEHALGMDNNADLIALYKAVQEGWEPFTLDIDRELYADYRDSNAQWLDPAMRGFIGVGASYGGKWFGGHAHGGFNADGTPRNHAAESWRALQLQARIWAQCDVRFIADTYERITKLKEPERCVIYCDPPYRGTTQGYSTTGFNNDAYELVCETLVQRGALLVCSEYAMPEPWLPVWSGTMLKSLDAASFRQTGQETIWMHASQVL